MYIFQGVDEAIEDYRSIESMIMTEQEEANSTHRIAMDLQTRAKRVDAQANQVSLEELLGNLCLTLILIKFQIVVARHFVSFLNFVPFRFTTAIQ